MNFWANLIAIAQAENLTLSQTGALLPALPHSGTNTSPSSPRAPRLARGRLCSRAEGSPDGFSLPQGLKQIFINTSRVPGLLLGAGDTSVNMNIALGRGERSLLPHPHSPPLFPASVLPIPASLLPQPPSFETSPHSPPPCIL